MAEQPINSPASLSDEDFRKAMGFPESYLVVTDSPACAPFSRLPDGSPAARVPDLPEAKRNG